MVRRASLPASCSCSRNSSGRLFGGSMPNPPAPSESAAPLRNTSSQTARRGADSESVARANTRPSP
eukprot:scaffold9713_cov103-Isochrysis_galbana.AAC.1